METPGQEALSTTQAPDGLPLPRRYWAMAVMYLGIIVAVLDGSMTSVALPTIAQDLNIHAGRVVWVTVAYSLTIVMTLLPLTALIERVGYQNMFRAGMAICIAAGLACAFAPSFAVLIAARVALGLGTSMLMCLVGGLVRNVYPMHRLGLGISMNSIVVGCIAVLGPTVGAIILDIASWPWIFVVHVPFSVVCLLGAHHLPDGARVKRPFDWRSGLLSMAMFGLLVLGLDIVAATPWQGLACLAGGALAAVVLLRWSLGQTAPMVPVDLLKVPSVGFSVAASAFSFAALTGAFVAMPFYFLEVRQYTYGQLGVLMGLWAFGTVAMAPVAGQLSDRHGVELLCTIGGAAMMLGMILAIALPDNGGLWPYALTMLLGGGGFGFFQTPNNRALLIGAPRQRSGAAGGLQAVTRTFGQSMGMALVGIALGLSDENGAVWGMAASIACAAGALGVNVARLRR